MLASATIAAAGNDTCAGSFATVGGTCTPLTNANSGNLEREDVWSPQHLPTSEMQDWTYGRRIAATRHQEGSNGTFLDGHSAWIKGTTMTVNMWRDKWR